MLREQEYATKEREQLKWGIGFTCFVHSCMLKEWKEKGECEETISGFSDQRTCITSESGPVMTGDKDCGFTKMLLKLERVLDGRSLNTASCMDSGDYCGSDMSNGPKVKAVLSKCSKDTLDVQRLESSSTHIALADEKSSNSADTWIIASCNYSSGDQCMVKCVVGCNDTCDITTMLSKCSNTINIITQRCVQVPSEHECLGAGDIGEKTGDQISHSNEKTGDQKSLSNGKTGDQKSHSNASSWKVSKQKYCNDATEQVVPLDNEACNVTQRLSRDGGCSATNRSNGGYRPVSDKGSWTTSCCKDYVETMSKTVMSSRHACTFTWILSECSEHCVQYGTYGVQDSDGNITQIGADSWLASVDYSQQVMNQEEMMQDVIVPTLTNKKSYSVGEELTAMNRSKNPELDFYVTCGSHHRRYSATNDISKCIIEMMSGGHSSARVVLIDNECDAINTKVMAGSKVCNSITEYQMKADGQESNSFINCKRSMNSGASCIIVAVLPSQECSHTSKVLDGSDNEPTFTTSNVVADRNGCNCATYKTVVTGGHGSHSDITTFLKADYFSNSIEERYKTLKHMKTAKEQFIVKKTVSLIMRNFKG